MDHPLLGSLLRGRRLESCLEAKVRSVEEHEEAAVRRPEKAEDGWVSVAVSGARVVACFLTMMVTTAVWAGIMLLLLPWPYERIRQGNLYGHVTGRLMMWILGNPIKIRGSEFSTTRAIYICNHASPIDIFLVMWLTPIGTVGIAKKEAGVATNSPTKTPSRLISDIRHRIFLSYLSQIIWYPLFGQLYVLAKHLRIDRSNPAAAVESLKEAARAVRNNDLSLVIFPEGTRSRSGRLLPFKKGFAHIALQTRLPIVPMVLTGTHLAWRKDSLRVRPAPITVKYLPPIKTDEWEKDKMNEYIEMIHSLYVQHLPEAQKPSA